jgi:mannosyltransferase OCH1-like enzyme
MWGYIREKIILYKHRKTAGFWNQVIRAYFDGKIERYSFIPFRQFPENKKIIWQYWGQGINEESLPGVVRICFASVDKYKGEYEVIRLCDDTVKDYIDFPGFIWKKRKNGQLSVAFFSDLLRLALLHTYGGVWLDATILLTGFLPEEYVKLDYFVFQRDDNE